MKLKKKQIRECCHEGKDQIGNARRLAELHVLYYTTTMVSMVISVMTIVTIHYTARSLHTTIQYNVTE